MNAPTGRNEPRWPRNRGTPYLNLRSAEVIGWIWKADLKVRPYSLSHLYPGSVVRRPSSTGTPIAK